jgi:hypothetical protein
VIVKKSVDTTLIKLSRMNGCEPDRRPFAHLLLGHLSGDAYEIIFVIPFEDDFKSVFFH